MSNNKQSMKLYTEEQVNKAMLDYIQGILPIDIFNSLTPIELPSEDEIIEVYDSHIDLDLDWIGGALWMRDKIQGGNK